MRNTTGTNLPLAQDATEKRESTVNLVCPVYSVQLVLVRRLAGPTDKTDKIDQTNQLRFASKSWLLSASVKE